MRRRTWPAAAGSEVLLGEGKERVVVTATLVVFSFGVAGEVFDSRVSTHAETAAEVFVHGAVDVADQSRLGVGKLITEFVPSRLHPLAVASPRREELNERSF